MTNEAYNHLSCHLTKVVSNIPLRWGSVQNDDADSKILMFDYDTYDALEIAIRKLQPETKNYFKKRWFLWKCAQCDEYLFYRHSDVKRNPNHKDQNWDFEFFANDALRFDLKGTVIPRKFRDYKQGKYPDPMKVITFFYDQQSRGVRNHSQNRLFIMHQPYSWKEENHLRANFEAKQNVFDAYIDLLRRNPNHRFFEYEGYKADLIYLTEQANGSIVHNIASIAINNSLEVSI